MRIRNPRNVCVFDVETTGVGKKDRILQITVMCRDPAGRVKKLDTLIKPPVRINPAAQKIHGISYRDVRNAPKFGAVRNRIKRMMKTSDVVVGHNVAFDLRMLRKEGINIPPHKVRDTMRMAEKRGVYDGGDGRVSLDDMTKGLNLDIGEYKRHSAIGDTHLTFQGYLKMLKMKPAG